MRKVFLILFLFLVCWSSASLAGEDQFGVFVQIDNGIMVREFFPTKVEALQEARAIVERGYITRVIRCGRRAALDCQNMLRILPIHRVDYIEIRKRLRRR